MSKKVTQKDFKEIMTLGGFDFDAFEYGGILNTFSILLEEAAKLYAIEYTISGHELDKEMSEIRHRQSHRIYEALTELGYYED